MSKKRIEIIDIAKAITIFFVIMGHTTSNLDESLFRRTIYSFHMPLFLILAGLSIRPTVISGIKDAQNFLKKNILALIVPYFIWGLIYGNFSYGLLKYLAFGSWEALVEAGTLTSLWYLPCFFVARIIVQIETNCILKYKPEHNQLTFIIAGIITAALGFFIPHPDGGMIWCADIAVLAAGFILFGMGIRTAYITLAQQKTGILVATSLIGLVLFFMCTYGRPNDLYLCLMCKGDYGNMLWFFWISMLGSIAVLAFSWVIFRVSRESAISFETKLITTIGTHTMGIFIIHKPFLQEVVMPGVQDVFTTFPIELTALISTVIVLCYSIVLCMIIEKFIPQLLGQFPR